MPRLGASASVQLALSSSFLVRQAAYLESVISCTRKRSLDASVSSVRPDSGLVVRAVAPSVHGECPFASWTPSAMPNPSLPSSAHRNPATGELTTTSKLLCRPLAMVIYPLPFGLEMVADWLAVAVCWLSGGSHARKTTCLSEKISES